MGKYFITATGTEVGKTYVTCMLLKQLKNAIGLKPVVSGYEPLQDNDLKLIAKACKQPESEIGLYKFTNPVAPNLAASQEGVNINTSKITGFINKQSANYQNTVLEGAGGAFAPVTDSQTFMDILPKLNDFKSILVSANYLGTISHTVATFKAMQAANATPQLIILNQASQTDTQLFSSNCQDIEHFTGCKTLQLGFGGDIDICKFI